MFSLRADWNPKQTALKEALSKPKRFNEAIRLCLELHGLVHSGKAVSKKTPTFFDELLDGLTKEAFSVMPSPKDTTIAWNIWHITRIEDITANILIAGGKQVLNNLWLKKLGTRIRDTGNAMTKD
ncbi:MAG: DinB family protein, partial [Treponema sp.]|nr:DinB family protein [Treponema sp.]